VCAAAHLLQRVSTQQPQTLPASPLSFGSPAHNLTSQRMMSPVPSGDVVGSASETARQASLGVAHPCSQITRLADEPAAKTEERKTRRVFSYQIIS